MPTKNLVTYTASKHNFKIANDTKIDNTGSDHKLVGDVKLTYVDTGKGSCTIDEQNFICNDQITDKIMIRCAMYMLKIDVFNQLVEQYLSVPLIFPIQTVQGKDFQTPLEKDDMINTAMTVHLQHCDSAYTVFRKDSKSTMCFLNPEIRYQFNIDGKYYPREEYNSISDIRSINYTLDALNVNNSNITSIGEDFRSSLQPYTKVVESPAGGIGKDAAITTKQLNTTGAKTNFMIGIPFTDSEDFGGGISTNGTVQIQLTGHRLNPNEGGTTEGKARAFGQPLTIFTEDAILKIRSTKPAGMPQWSISHASVEQVIGGGAM